MTNAIIADIKAGIAKLEAALAPAETAVADDADAIGSATLNFIKTNGLQDLYQIAITVVGAMLPGASWTAALASIESQAVAAGKQLVSGSTAIVAALAQADLLAAGKSLAPGTTVTA
jgi:hypothetical protein